MCGNGMERELRLIFSSRNLFLGRGIIDLIMDYAMGRIILCKEQELLMKRISKVLPIPTIQYPGMFYFAYLRNDLNLLIQVKPDQVIYYYDYWSEYEKEPCYIRT